MQEDIIFKRRNRLKKHFVNTSNVLLYCYAYVSDAAKITYQVIDGFDWESKETGESKGYVFPAVETIAEIRHTSVRTIQRHILELIHANLLTRIRRKNMPSILYIEEVSDEEVAKYFRHFDAKEKKREPVQFDKSGQLRNDKNVVSSQAEETTKMSFAYKEENEEEENENNVNEDETKEQKKQGSGLASLAEISLQYDIEKYRSSKNRTNHQPRTSERNMSIMPKRWPGNSMMQKASAHSGSLRNTFLKALFFKHLALSKKLREMEKSSTVREHCLWRLSRNGALPMGKT
jgi:hypothetical protein